MKIMKGGFATKTMSTTCSCKKQYDKSNVYHMNGTVESCMAIYLGMAMEMPIGRYGGCFEEGIW